MASPTAASHTATIITKRANICPSTEPGFSWLKATKFKFEAFSISSMPSSTIIVFCFVMIMSNPKEKSKAARIKKCSIGNINFYLL